MSTVRPYTGPGKYPVRVYVGTNPLTGRPRRRSETIHARSEKEYRREVARVRRKLEDERDALFAGTKRERLEKEIRVRQVELERLKELLGDVM